MSIASNREIQSNRLQGQLMSLVNADKFSSVLASRGVVIVRGFLDSDKTRALRAELGECFSSKAKGSIKGAYLRQVGFRRRSLDIPDAGYVVRSLNLYEEAISISEIIQKTVSSGSPQSDLLDFRLTMLSASVDSDPDKLELHSDNLDRQKVGMFRAILYLSDADESSGAFQYVQGSHQDDHNLDHYANQTNIPTNAEKLLSCNGEAGDLVIFNAYGIHGRNPCINPRTSLSFEFLPATIALRNDGISLTPGHRSPKVLKSISLFSNTILSEKDNRSIIDDQLSGKFWCPTTQYFSTPPVYMLPSTSQIRRIFVSAALSILPLSLQNKTKRALRKLKVEK